MKSAEGNNSAPAPADDTRVPAEDAHDAYIGQQRFMHPLKHQRCHWQKRCRNARIRSVKTMEFAQRRPLQSKAQAWDPESRWAWARHQGTSKHWACLKVIIEHLRSKWVQCICQFDHLQKLFPAAHATLVGFEDTGIWIHPNVSPHNCQELKAFSLADWRSFRHPTRLQKQWPRKYWNANQHTYMAKQTFVFHFGWIHLNAK